MSTGAEILQEFFDHYKTDYIFGNPGTTETSFLEAISHCKETKYILALQESSVIGIAAGYAMVSEKPSIVNIHTYPGLANSLCNLYNAYTSGIPLLVIAGQQDRRHLIHNPVLSGKLTKLAETATKYQYEVMRADDLAIALQRCYCQAALTPSGPTFLSIPMDILEETSKMTYFKDTEIIQDNCIRDVRSLVKMIQETKKGKLAFLVDYESGVSHSEETLNLVADELKADIYAAPYHVRRVVDPKCQQFKGHLPALSSDIHTLLSNYETVILLGEKVDTFLFTGRASVPKEIKLVQISSSSNQLAFDYPCDLAILGNINATLRLLFKELGCKATNYSQSTPESTAQLEKIYGEKSNSKFSAKMVYRVLTKLDPSYTIVTEGSSEDDCVQKIAQQLQFKTVHFSPRGGGLGWAMPVATGVSLATKKHSICFVGDGGSLFAIHSIWTAAKHKIPVIFVCFVNGEYKILKNLWCMQKKTEIEKTHFIGLDFNDPAIDLKQIATGFGAKSIELNSLSEVDDVMEEALKHQGPTFLMVDCIVV